MSRLNPRRGALAAVAFLAAGLFGAEAAHAAPVAPAPILAQTGVTEVQYGWGHHGPYGGGWRGHRRHHYGHDHYWRGHRHGHHWGHHRGYGGGHWRHHRRGDWY